MRLSEFLIHAADVEGLCQGIDEELVKSESLASDICPFGLRANHSLLSIGLCRLPELSEWVTIPTTYAGGARGGSLEARAV